MPSEFPPALRDAIVQAAPFFQIENINNFGDSLAPYATNAKHVFAQLQQSGPQIQLEAAILSFSGILDATLNAAGLTVTAVPLSAVTSVTLTVNSAGVPTLSVATSFHAPMLGHVESLRYTTGTRPEQIERLKSFSRALVAAVVAR